MSWRSVVADCDGMSWITPKAPLRDDGVQSESEEDVGWLLRGSRFGGRRGQQEGQARNRALDLDLLVLVDEPWLLWKLTVESRAGCRRE